VSASGALSPAVKKARLVSAYVRRQPIWCTWQVTRRCPSACLFCEHRADGLADEVELPECLRIVEGLGRIGSMIVSLSGGEPFLRSDLSELIGALAARHFPLLTTHGAAVTKAKARAVWQAGLECASVTLFDADPARHDGRVGVAGAHARAVGTLATLAAERVRPSQQVNVKVPLEAGAAEAVERVLDLASKHGASVSVEPAYPVARGESRATAALLRQLKARHPHLRSSPFFLDRFDEAVDTGVPGCQAGRAFLNVDHRGRVTKCLEFRRPEDRAGDLLADDVSAVLPRLRRLHEANECRSCWYGSRGEVEGLYTVRGLLRSLPMLVWS
jgi:MoaA/NifB/PqqE/SkfB family radical SAM enzyme